MTSYETFVVPDDIGGRFSVLTPVGLLPMAAAGLDIDAVMAGAAAAREDYSQGSLHDCARYAALRNLLLFKGKSMEIMVNYEPSLVMLGEWLKQLFDESEGKDHKGLFATSANFSTDLHRSASLSRTARATCSKRLSGCASRVRKAISRKPPKTSTAELPCGQERAVR